jgi:O-acetyl-ADP-ribose deacetylase (regulator of RNase III)
MKIKYIKGNLFNTDCNFIVHGCNSHGVMGSGVAKIVKEKYPEAYTDYINKFKFSGLKLGDIQVVPCKSKTIINAITQENYGRDGSRFVSYDAVADCMEKINELFYMVPNGTLAMPKIGAGLGGGNWNIIAAIIENELTVVQPVVYEL